MVSPLEESYSRQIESLANTLNSLNGDGTVQLFPFETMAEFAQQIQILIERSQPWESDDAEAIE
jgi:CRISPR-associated protein Cst2